MENLRNRRNIDFETTAEKLKKLAAQPSFKKFTIFHEHLTAVERVKVELNLNRPIFIGFAILELKKMLMYDFHYNYIKQKYPKEYSKLMFTDTDSLTYSIKTNNIYEDMFRDKHLLDLVVTKNPVPITMR